MSLKFKSYRDGATPLQVAVTARNTELAELLLQQGAYVNTQDSGGDTPLHSAVSRCDQPTTLVLINHGADPELKNKKGELPGDRVTKCDAMESWDQGHPALAVIYAEPVN